MSNSKHKFMVGQHVRIKKEEDMQCINTPYGKLTWGFGSEGIIERITKETRNNSQFTVLTLKALPTVLDCEVEPLLIAGEQLEFDFMLEK